MCVKLGSTMLVQVERTRSTDWVLGSVVALRPNKVEVVGTVITRIDRATGMSVDPDGASAVVVVPTDLVGEDEAEVLEW